MVFVGKKGSPSIDSSGLFNGTGKKNDSLIVNKSFPNSILLLLYHILYHIHLHSLYFQHRK